MEPSDEPPWMDYSGQTTRELLESRATHRTDSILAAFGTALEFNRVAPHCRLSPNGRDRCQAVGALGTKRPSPAAVQDAVSRRSTRRDRILRECDEEFFSVQNEVYEIEPRLLAFIERHQEKIELLKGYELPEEDEEEDTGSGSPAEWIALMLEYVQTKNPSPEGLRKLARQYASEMDEPAAEAEVEAAVVLYEFWLKADARSPANAEPYARKAFDVGRHEFRHCLTHRYWVDRLTQTGHAALADTWALEYVD